MKTLKTISISLIISTLIVLWGWREWNFYQQIEAEKRRIPFIEEIQLKLLYAGYDIGTDGVDGRLSDCNTVKAWYAYEFNQYAEPYFTRTGKPKND